MISTQRPSAPSLPTLANGLEAVIRQRLGNRVRDLRVVVEAEGVVLQGQTATYHVKQIAQHAAMEAAGLPILANRIEVC